MAKISNEEIKNEIQKIKDKNRAMNWKVFDHLKSIKTLKYLVSIILFALAFEFIWFFGIGGAESFNFSYQTGFIIGGAASLITGFMVYVIYDTYLSTIKRLEKEIFEEE